MIAKGGEGQREKRKKKKKDVKGVNRGGEEGA